MWSNCLKILISSGLVLSFLLISCSDDTSYSDDTGNESTVAGGNVGASTGSVIAGSNIGDTGGSVIAGSDAGDTGSVIAGSDAGDTGIADSETADSGAQLDLSEHWISSVPFQKIEARIFTMGSPASEPNRRSAEDQVEVTISKPFEIMTTEVTQSQWFKVMGSNPSRFKTEGDCADYDSENEMCPNNPVEKVSWDDVQEYIKKLNDSLGLTGCDGTPSSSTGCYRLPTEAEWEYSARGGTNTAYFFGNAPSDLGNYAWYSDNSDDKTHPVGSKVANPYNLYDVHGNVWEWVQDMYTDILLGGTDPLNLSGLYRVIRGGSWNHSAIILRSAYRGHYRQDYKTYAIGFRLVRTL